MCCRSRKSYTGAGSGGYGGYGSYGSSTYGGYRHGPRRPASYGPRTYGGGASDDSDGDGFDYTSFY